MIRWFVFYWLVVKLSSADGASGGWVGWLVGWLVGELFAWRFVLVGLCVLGLDSCGLACCWWGVGVYASCASFDC